MIADFSLDLARAITEQLVEQFNGIDPSPLTIEALATAKAQPGVYQLFLNGDLVYVGKSDTNLNSRLDRHRKALTGRKNLGIAQMSFKGMHLEKNWSALTTEAQLIAHFGDTPWNNSGFGSNDPGRNRDQTALRDGHFDASYPIDVDYRTDVPAGETSAARLIPLLKSQLPYLIRCERIGADVDITIPDPGMTTRELLKLIASHLEGDWQATALPGRILLYKEKNKSYPGAEILWPET